MQSPKILIPVKVVCACGVRLEVGLSTDAASLDGWRQARSDTPQRKEKP